MSKKSIEKSLGVLEKYELTEPPVDPIYITEQEGLTVKLCPFPEQYKNVSGFIHYDTKSIYINELEDFLPRRFFYHCS